MHNLDAGFGFNTTRYFRLARHALAAGLEVLRLQSGDKVLVPAFICRDLLASIHAVGAEPLFYEVDIGLRPVLLEENPSVRAVLAVNYFGFPQDLRIFQDYCERTGAHLIEDNAHGFLSADAEGSILGTRGDLGIHSMRKTFILPDGAALVVNSPALQNHVPNQLAFLQSGLGISFRLKRLLSSMQRSLRLPALAWMQNLVRWVRYIRTGHAITPLAEENEYELPSDPAPHQYIVKALKVIDKQGESQRRRGLYQRFQLQLAYFSIQPVFTSLPPNTVPYGFPFYASDSDAALVVKVARSAGLDCVRWPDLPKAVALRAPVHYQSLWMINFLC